jgi:hypothetical protein
MLLKQNYDYDCGHTCLQFFNIEPPQKDSELSGHEIIAAAKDRFSSIYLNKNDLDQGHFICLTLLTEFSTFHWVAMRDGFIFEPKTGGLFSVEDYLSKYNSIVIYGIGIKSES